MNEFLVACNGLNVNSKLCKFLPTMVVHLTDILFYHSSDFVMSYNVLRKGFYSFFDEKPCRVEPRSDF